jgi:hypothetical protein
MAVSEAGLLPFFSDWNAIDTWGLNDSWIAHHGEITPEYLDRFRPHIIMFHAYFSPASPADPTPEHMRDPWFRMTLTLRDYAEQRGYILAAAFGPSPQNTHYYYVRPDFEDSARIVREIAGLRYGFGGLAINYASGQALSR